jgi:biopolymer transport protein ExbB/TolQ
MNQLFIDGGPLYMGIQTGILIIMAVWAVYHFLPVLTKKGTELKQTKVKLKHIKTIGSFGFIFGIFSQLLGLYHAFGVIAEASDISTTLMMKGLELSMIPPLFGMIIFMISLIVWMILDYLTVKLAE